MGVKVLNSHCSVKETVTVRPYKDGLRIRWRVKDQRPQLYITQRLSDYRQKAEKIKKVIAQDLHNEVYDETLQRYKNLLEDADRLELFVSQLKFSVPISGTTTNTNTKELNLVEQFDNFLKARGKGKDIPNYYFHVRQMMVRWGKFEVEDVPSLLSTMNYAATTFNSRLGCLSSFFEWMIRRNLISENPLIEMIPKRRSRQTNAKRKPFTSEEVCQILDALRNDTFSQSRSWPHSQYHDFVSFLFQTGVRNGEGIGLTVADVHFNDGEIVIRQSLSRTRKGSNAAARVLKSTKMDNERHLPMSGSPELKEMLLKNCAGKSKDDFVFTSKKGNPIDDRMFQRRIYKPLLEKLGINNRDLYACRHTFATRAVQSGMRPDQVAYIMGDEVETVLKNYFHNDSKPLKLPSLFTNTGLKLQEQIG